MFILYVSPCVSEKKEGRGMIKSVFTFFSVAAIAKQDKVIMMKLSSYTCGRECIRIYVPICVRTCVCESLRVYVRVCGQS